MIYNMLKRGSEYVERGLDYYEREYKGRVLRNLRKRAKDLGYALIEIEANASA